MSLSYLRKDLEAASRSANKIQNLKWAFLNHTYHMVFLIRLGQSLSRLPFFGKAFALLVNYIIRIIFASDISVKAKIGSGLVIVHGHDIVIGADTVIGINCKIFNGVTLGNRDIEASSKGNQPRIGSNVLIATGAKVIGAVKVGDYVQIGANSVVLKDCLDNSTYVGVPAKKVV